MDRTLRRASAVRADLDEIWFYTSATGDQAADAVLDRIGAAEQKLLKFPELGVRRDKLGDEVRMLAVGAHLLFYRVLPDGIEMLRVIDGRRDLRAEVISGA